MAQRGNVHKDRQSFKGSSLTCFVIVVGAEEAKSRTVNIRNRDDQATQTKGELIPLQDALEAAMKLKAERRRVNKF